MSLSKASKNAVTDFSPRHSFFNIFERVLCYFKVNFLQTTLLSVVILMV